MALKVEIKNVEFPSDGNTLRGRIYIPELKAKKPAVVICHGYPGNTKNTDLAEELALNGIISLIFHPQGAWGSTGNYSLMRLGSGTRAAIDYLRTLEKVDQSRIGIVSHSMGNLALVEVMTRDPTIKTGILLSPPDLRVFASEDVVRETAFWMNGIAGFRLKGVSVESLIDDLSGALKTLNPVDLVSKIRAPLMVVVGSNDTRVTPEQARRVFNEANEPKRFSLIDGADHDFSDHRVPMIKVVLERLNETL
jgi:dienelactone hydrolase